jgi:hypothetical protein
MHRYPLPGSNSYLTIRRHMIESRYGDLVADPAHPCTSPWQPGGLNAGGSTHVRAWVTALFYDAEHVRHLSRRCRMRAWWSNSYGVVRFARAYTADDITRWADTLLRILRGPAYLRTLDPVQVP